MISGNLYYVLCYRCQNSKILTLYMLKLSKICNICYVKGFGSISIPIKVNFNHVNAFLRSRLGFIVEYNGLMKCF